MWDIRKTKDFGQPKAQWGREYYAKDGMGWYVPVLFVPYFEWRSSFMGKVTRRPVWQVLKAGVRDVWADLPRIMRKQWYCEEA